MLYRKHFLKETRNTSRIRPLNFEKKWYRILSGILQKKWRLRISCNNSNVITSQIELKNLAQARKPKRHPFFSVRYYNVFCFFLSFSQLLPVLVPASFSTLLSFVRKFLKLPVLWMMWFTLYTTTRACKSDPEFFALL